MKMYKKGISLIVLVITIIVLIIIATTVIVSLSSTNIIKETSNTVFKSDMQSYKDVYAMYLADYMMQNDAKTSDSLNVKASDVEFTEIFGTNVKDEYKEKLEIVAGRLVYRTADPELVPVLKELNMAITVVPTTLAVGDLVEYIPTADPGGTYSGATYAKDTVATSTTYNTYIEKTKDTYTPGNMKWVYLGQDEAGNVLLTSQEATNFTMTIAGQDGFVDGPSRLDTLCNTLYGNSTYALATRNMKIEDINRVLGYPGETGNLGSYYDQAGTIINTPIAKTIGQIETELGKKINNRKTPRKIPAKAFEDYLSDYYSYTGAAYKGESTDEYKVIFKKADGTTNQSIYWLSSSNVNAIVCDGYAYFNVRRVNGGRLTAYGVFCSNNAEYAPSYALRPVIVLKPNIQFGEKNSNGELKLVEM